ncbi:MAG: hypothetical protein NTW50_00830 [Candidatus Berkelbacteria bacterium]|nr:hypothetical protein [Candidatus Berkelbacteria bacterium]
MKEHLSNKRMILILLHSPWSITVIIALTSILICVSSMTYETKLSLGFIIAVIEFFCWYGCTDKDRTYRKKIVAETGETISSGWIRSATAHILWDDNSMQDLSIESFTKQGGPNMDNDDWIWSVYFHDSICDYFLAKREGKSREWHLERKTEIKCDLVDQNNQSLPLPLIAGKRNLHREILAIVKNCHNVQDFLLKSARRGYLEQFETDPQLAASNFHDFCITLQDYENLSITSVLEKMIEIGYIK